MTLKEQQRPAQRAERFADAERSRRLFRTKVCRKGRSGTGMEESIVKIILSKDVKSLGKKGDVVEVSDGYARNYILPRKLGIEASNKNMNDLKLQKANQEKMAQEQLEKAQEFARAMEEDEVVLSIKAGEGGRTFGSVSSKEIAQGYKDQCGREIDKKKIVLPEAIKSFGVFEVAVKLHPKVTGKLKVKVTEMKG